jgi:hypothetical protein
LKEINSLTLLIFLVGLIILLIRSGLLGLRYDILKRDSDSKYSDNHFGTSMGLRLPLKIDETNRDQIIQKAINNYNKSVAIFWRFIWISFVMMILLFCINYY